MTGPDVLAVHRADRAQACRRCAQDIHRGGRVAIVAGIGAVHLRCLLSHQADDTPEEAAITASPDHTAPAPTTPRPDPSTVADAGDENEQELAVRRGWDR